MHPGLTQSLDAISTASVLLKLAQDKLQSVVADISTLRDSNTLTHADQQHAVQILARLITADGRLELSRLELPVTPVESKPKNPTLVRRTGPHSIRVGAAW
jgi:hypothetical protein